MDNEMTKTLRVPVTLTDDQHAKLVASAERRGLTISAFIRMAALEKATE